MLINKLNIMTNNIYIINKLDIYKFQKFLSFFSNFNREMIFC